MEFPTSSQRQKKVCGTTPLRKKGPSGDGGHRHVRPRRDGALVSAENAAKDSKRDHESKGDEEKRTRELCGAEQFVAHHLTSPEEKVTAPSMKLTKYEHVHVLGMRANELASGAKPLLCSPCSYLDPFDIAMEEMKQGLLTSKVVRNLPSGEKEVHTLEELMT